MRCATRAPSAQASSFDTSITTGITTGTGESAAVKFEFSTEVSNTWSQSQSRSVAKSTEEMLGTDNSVTCDSFSCDDPQFPVLWQWSFVGTQSTLDGDLTAQMNTCEYACGSSLPPMLEPWACCNPTEGCTKGDYNSVLVTSQDTEVLQFDLGTYCDDMISTFGAPPDFYDGACNGDRMRSPCGPQYDTAEDSASSTTRMSDEATALLVQLGVANDYRAIFENQAVSTIDDLRAMGDEDYENLVKLQDLPVGVKTRMMRYFGREEGQHVFYHTVEAKTTGMAPSTSCAANTCMPPAPLATLLCVNAPTPTNTSLNACIKHCISDPLCSLCAGTDATTMGWSALAASKVVGLTFTSMPLAPDIVEDVRVTVYAKPAAIDSCCRTAPWSPLPTGEKSGCVTNLVQNPSFDRADEWTFIEDGVAGIQMGAGLVQSSLPPLGLAHSGEWALQSRCPTTPLSSGVVSCENGVEQSVTLEPHTPYRLSAWARVEILPAPPPPPPAYTGETGTLTRVLPQASCDPDAPVIVHGYDNYIYSTPEDAYSACLLDGCEGVGSQADIEAAGSNCLCQWSNDAGVAGYYMSYSDSSGDCGSIGWNSCGYTSAAVFCTGCVPCASPPGTPSAPPPPVVGSMIIGVTGEGIQSAKSSVTISSTEWTQETIRFTTGESVDDIKVYIAGNNSARAVGYADDVVIVPECGQP